MHTSEIYVVFVFIDISFYVDNHLGSFQTVIELFWWFTRVVHG
jgi:hypothetical protein